MGKCNLQAQTQNGRIISPTLKTDCPQSFRVRSLSFRSRGSLYFVLFLRLFSVCTSKSVNSGYPFQRVPSHDPFVSRSCETFQQSLGSHGSDFRAASAAVHYFRQSCVTCVTFCSLSCLLPSPPLKTSSRNIRVKTRQARYSWRGSFSGFRGVYATFPSSVTWCLLLVVGRITNSGSIVLERVSIARIGKPLCVPSKPLTPPFASRSLDRRDRHSFGRR